MPIVAWFFLGFVLFIVGLVLEDLFMGWWRNR